MESENESDHERNFELVQAEESYYDNDAHEIGEQSIAIRTAQELLSRIRFLHDTIRSECEKIEEADVDYDLIEHMSQRIETLSESLEGMPVKDLATAQAKINYYVEELRKGVEDEVTIDLLKSRLNKVMKSYAMHMSDPTV